MRLRTPRPFVVDLLIALALNGVAVLLAHVSRAAQGWPEPDGRAHALIALAHLPLALRGRWPLAVLAVVQAASLTYVTLGYWSVACVFGPMLALYTVAALRPPRIAIACAAFKVAAWGYGALVSRNPSIAAVMVQAVVYCSVVVWFGTVTRRSAELTRRLREEQAERARRAVAEERGRIAREMHDVVAHHMSVISVQAGLARFVFDSDPVKARCALGTIEDTSAEALEELRRMLQVLREEDPRAPKGPRCPPWTGWRSWSNVSGPAASRSSWRSKARRARSRPASSCAPTASSRRLSPTSSSTPGGRMRASYSATGSTSWPSPSRTMDRGWFRAPSRRAPDMAWA
jgi:hypothetical protein